MKLSDIVAVLGMAAIIILAVVSGCQTTECAMLGEHSDCN
jgi:hypothetical protein